MRLRSVVGTVKLSVWYGYDPGGRRWGCPIRQHWGLSAHQQLSPTLEDKLAFTVSATGSYAQAAAVSAKWGTPADDSSLHALAQRLGARAEEQTRVRLQTRSEEHTSELQSRLHLVCRLLLEKKKENEASEPTAGDRTTHPTTDP